MYSTNLIELPIADHFQVTDKLTFPDSYTWECFTDNNVKPLASVNPDKKLVFRDVNISDVAKKVGYVAVSQFHPMSTMRFVVDFNDNGTVELTYTGFDLSPIDMLSNTGHSIDISLEYYQQMKSSIILYASCVGYYWIARQTNDVSIL
jgi:hypothetical protein